MTTQKETARFFGSAKSPEHPGGYAILKMQISRTDWVRFANTYANVIFERPVHQGKKGETETLIPLEHVEKFVKELQKSPGITVDEYQYP